MADPRLEVVQAGPAPDEGPAFYFDFAAPEAYLAAERILSLLPVPCEWKPIRAPQAAPVDRDEIERLVASRGMQPLQWPSPFPFDTELALRAAVYARAGGKTVSFALAAFRQAYAGGRQLDETTVLLAGAACELHPRALLKGVELQSTQRELERLTEEAATRGVRSVPAIWTGTDVLHGDGALERAALALTP